MYRTNWGVTTQKRPRFTFRTGKPLGIWLPKRHVFKNIETAVVGGEYKYYYCTTHVNYVSREGGSIAGGNTEIEWEIPPPTYWMGELNTTQYPIRQPSPAKRASTEYGTLVTSKVYE